MERDRKMTRSILLILAVFQSCFLPFAITWLVIISCLSCHARVDLVLGSYHVTIALTFFNSCINPFLYAFRLPKFRRPILFILRKLFFCCKSLKVENSPPGTSAPNNRTRNTNNNPPGSIENNEPMHMETKL